MLGRAEIRAIKVFIIFLSKLKFVPFEYNVQTGKFYPHHRRISLWLCCLNFAVFMAQTAFVDMRLLQLTFQLVSENKSVADEFYLVLWHINVASSATVVFIWYVIAFIKEGFASCQVLNLLYPVPRKLREERQGKKVVAFLIILLNHVLSISMLFVLLGSEILAKTPWLSSLRSHNAQEVLALNIHKAYVVTVCMILGVELIEPGFKNLLISVFDENGGGYYGILLAACSIQEAWFLLFIVFTASMVMQMHVLYFEKILQELKDAKMVVLHRMR